MDFDFEGIWKMARLTLNFAKTSSPSAIELIITIELTITKHNTMNNVFIILCNLQAEGLFPPVRIFLNLFPRAGYFFNASD